MLMCMQVISNNYYKKPLNNATQEGEICQMKKSLSHYVLLSSDQTKQLQYNSTKVDLANVKCNSHRNYLFTLLNIYIYTWYTVIIYYYNLGYLKPAYVSEGNVCLILSTAQLGSTILIDFPSQPQHHRVSWR